MSVALLERRLRKQTDAGLQISMLRQTITKAVITNAQFETLANPILGLPVSWVWRGYGSAIFLEIGELTAEKKKSKKDGKERISYLGQYGVMIQWSWRVERPQSIYFGSWSTDKVIDNKLGKLNDRAVESIGVEGRLPELVLKLSGGLWVHSFATTDGQAEWCLFLDRKRTPREWVVSNRGKLIKETQIQ